MSECSDKNVGRLLHAFELDTLPEVQREVFEKHLYECDYCFERIQAFEKAALHLRHDPEVRKSIQGLTGSSERSARNQRRVRAVRTALAMAAVILVLLLNPWQLRIDTTDEATAVTTKIAVTYFDDLTPDTDSGLLGKMITNLLIADLSESQHIRAVSSQRLFDALKARGIREVMLADEHAVTEAAADVGAKWILKGTVLQTEQSLAVTYQLIDVKAGEVVMAERVDGVAGEDVFSVVDRLTPLIRSALMLSVPADSETDRPVAEITTGSAEAYASYLQGLEHRDRFELDEAKASFQRAVELDSSFAMAYYYLSMYGRDEERARNIAGALRNISRADRMSCYYIRSRAASLAGNDEEATAELLQLVAEFPNEKNALLTLGIQAMQARRYARAVDHFHQAIELDSFYAAAFNELAFAHFALGDAERAVEAVDRYTELLPDAPNPYDSRGEIMALSGRLSEAITSFDRALEADPEYVPSLVSLGCLLLFAGDEAAARDRFGRIDLSGRPELASTLEGYLAAFAIRQGRFAEALARLDSLIIVDQREGNSRSLITKHFMKSLILEAVDSLPAALEELDKCIMLHTQVRPDDFLSYYHYKGQVLALMGKSELAEQLANDLRSNLPEGWHRVAGPNYIMGCVDLSRGRYDEALKQLLAVPADSLRYPAGHLQARALLAAGRPSDAIRKFDEWLRRFEPSRLLWSTLDITAHYYLGVACEASGDIERSVAEYKSFIAAWGAAEPRPALVEDASERLRQLTTAP